MSHFSLTSTVKQYPDHPYEAIKDAVLGKRYEASLVFVGPARASSLNQTYRHKSYTPNVLSFPLHETAGEIFICPHIAAKEAVDYNLSVSGYIAFLFIHGLLHLKGFDHGATMEGQEARFMKRFKIS